MSINIHYRMPNLAFILTSKKTTDALGVLNTYFVSAAFIEYNIR